MNKQLKAQSKSFNQSGLARTQDHLMLTDGERRPKVRGQGQWKHWTPVAICRAAFSSPNQSARSIASQVQGGHLHALRCRPVVGTCILQGQKSGIQRLVNMSKGRKFKFWIANFMFDETKLPVSADPLGFRRSPVLARHGQASWDSGDGQPQDEDIIMEPVVMRRATSACTWAALALNDILPGERTPDAELYGTLISCDSGSCNVLTLKYLHTKLPDNHLMLTSVCVQHKTGSVIELLTRRLNTLTPCFCMANLFNKGDFFQGLRDRIQERVNLKMTIVHPDDFGRPRRHTVEEAILDKFFVKCHDREDDSMQKRQAWAAKFLEFVPGSWSSGSVCMH